MRAETRCANLKPGDLVVWRRRVNVQLSSAIKIDLGREETSIGILLEKAICLDHRNERSAARVLFGKAVQWVPLWQLLPLDEAEDRQGQEAS